MYTISMIKTKLVVCFCTSIKINYLVYTKKKKRKLKAMREIRVFFYNFNNYNKVFWLKVGSKVTGRIWIWWKEREWLVVTFSNKVRIRVKYMVSIYRVKTVFKKKNRIVRKKLLRRFRQSLPLCVCMYNLKSIISTQL